MAPTLRTHTHNIGVTICNFLGPLSQAEGGTAPLLRVGQFCYNQMFMGKVMIYHNVNKQLNNIYKKGLVVSRHLNAGHLDTIICSFRKCKSLV